jgi:hypothetical protein
MLNNTELMLEGTINFKGVPSVMDIGMNFMTPPEIPLSGCEENFTIDLASALFNTDLTDN